MPKAGVFEGVNPWKDSAEHYAKSADFYRDRYDREVAILKKALNFYADPKTYDSYGIPYIPHEEHPGCEVPDMGRTARTALDANEKKVDQPTHCREEIQCQQESGF